MCYDWLLIVGSLDFFGGYALECSVCGARGCAEDQSGMCYVCTVGLGGHIAASEADGPSRDERSALRRAGRRTRRPAALFEEFGGKSVVEGLLNDVHGWWREDEEGLFVTPEDMRRMRTLFAIRWKKRGKRKQLPWSGDLRRSASQRNATHRKRLGGGSDISDDWLYEQLVNTHICRYCDMSMVDDPLRKNGKTVDHIVARSLGGKHVMSNIQIICRSCNSRKAHAMGECPPPPRWAKPLHDDPFA